MGDEAIQATNDDASMCKRFAVQQGYWKDDYINYMIRRGERKAPEINRGYFARVRGVKFLMDQFLKITKCACQIVNLGAGFDTLFWRLKDEDKLPDLLIDVDFRSICSRKCQYIRTRPPLLDPVTFTSGDQSVVIENAELHSLKYRIIWADLRNPEQLGAKLETIQNFDKSKPTLFVAECVLVYLHPERSSALIKHLGNMCKTCMFINYEQVNMADRFGMVMINNLKGRKCDLAGVEVCKDMETQKSRFTENGWEGSSGLEMEFIYKNLPSDELQRIERLEFLDEFELLYQLLQHYCICWAWKDPDRIGLSSIDFKT